MKNYILFFTMLLPAFLMAQDSDTIQSQVMKEYNDLIAYTPKALRNTPTPEVFGQFPMVNISNVILVYKSQSDFGLKPKDKAWLTERTNSIATEFYMEDNPLFLKRTDGYSGCPESGYELKKENLSGKDVTVVHFCHGCTEDSSGEIEFINIFNSRTKQLLDRGK